MKPDLEVCVCVVFFFFVLKLYLVVDVSSPVSSSQWRCLVNSGYGAAVVRAFRSSNVVDENAPLTMKDALAGGIPHDHLDIYVFPSPHSGDAQSQIDRTIAFLKGKVNFTNMWLDIEDTASHSYWGTDSASSKAFMSELYKAAVSRLGASRVGIYSSTYMWSLIFKDNNWNCCTASRLWYADYGGGPNFNDYRAFGGWSHPAAKQYQGDAHVCGVDVDLDYIK